MKLLFRVEGGTQVGTGHVMRCLALAQHCCAAGDAVVFAMAGGAGNLARRLDAEGITVEAVTSEPGSDADAQETVERANGLGCDWLVLDGYDFTGAYQRRIKQAGLRLLALDDYVHSDHYWADLVLNQNAHASCAMYHEREPYTRLLLGPRYILLRREFHKWRGWERAIPDVARRILVTLGGSDPDNATLKVIRALQRFDHQRLEAIVVAGDSNPHLAQLQQAVNAGRGIELHTGVNNMAELLAWADLGITAGGTTVWERARMGLPGLMLVLAENQRKIAEFSEKAGLAWNLGSASLVSIPCIADAVARLVVDKQARAGMAQLGRELVDGHGADRVLDCLRAEAFTLRDVSDADARLIWEWANDPGVRAVSFASAPIPWESHVRWFAARLQDANCLFFIGGDAAGAPMGQVRYEIQGAEAVISIVVDPRSRGRGVGRALIRRGSRELFARRPVEMIHAYIRAGNVASRQAFLAAGYAEAPDTAVEGQPAHHLILRR